MKRGAYQHLIGSRASATLFRVGANTDRRLGVSWSVSPGTLIYVKTSSDQRRKFVGALLEHESRTIPVL